VGRRHFEGSEQLIFVSHLLPVYPVGQLQLNFLAPRKQVPELKQKSEHKSFSHFLPEKPGEQTH
jgi:hypothetical protein